MSSYNLSYVVSFSEVSEYIKQEISLIAQRSVAESGQSLYDVLKVYDKDKNVLIGFVQDGVDTILSAFHDCAFLTPMEDSGVSINFFLPDFNPDMTESVMVMLNRFLVLKAVTLWLQTRYPVLLESYKAMSDEAMMKLFTALRQRMAPQFD